MSGLALELNGYSVRFGHRTVLADVRLAVAPRGVTVLMGPGGTGKSTLLRGLSGALEGVAGVTIGGSASYDSVPLGTSNRWPRLVAQKARLVTSTVHNLLAESHPRRADLTRLEMRADLTTRAHDLGLGNLGRLFDTDVLSVPVELRRALTIFGASLSREALLCVDEPTADLPGDEASVVLDLLLALSRTRAVLFVTHNQRHAKAVASSVALLAGGVVQEQQPSDGFFTSPRTEAGRSWVRTGSCYVPSPDTPPEDLAPEFQAPPTPSVDTPLSEATRPPIAFVSAARGPNGFQWVQPGKLAGCPLPGVVHDATADLEALKRVGVTVLVTLTEAPLGTRGVDPSIVGIETVFFPVVDMEAPSVEEAERICATVFALKQQGQVVAYHCRAGLGRTGTLLAAQLIHEGAGAAEALTAVRRIDRRWVQSVAQEEFLKHFATWRADHQAPATPMQKPSRGVSTAP